ncbi:MAG TPA: chromosomal replication initiator protein DnaA [Candidatus Rifleibacterium sp.]|nr:chromosomal replication initiator protein DnaA [Candidatus Rifleibacterium sp.]HPT45262.1 chromosomal replication initiator protein DnaA [Candidatus Rifleibacterium sp.]
MISSLDTLWNKITTEIQADGSRQNQAHSKIFLSSITPAAIEGDHLVMEATSDFCRDLCEKRYADVITRILNSEKPALKYRLVTKSGRFGQIKPEQPAIPAFKTDDEAVKTVKAFPAKYDGMFNNKYTFDSFVVGKSNQFAYAVCHAVSQNPGNLHNPVFIYGGVGLGKTHLIQAIGQELLHKNPKARIAYLSSEAFTNEFIDSIKDKKTEAFRAKYRKIDLLLIDDIQFIAGKGSTQEEFFHTFNELFQQKKQIVLTSDNPPGKIQRGGESLEERLASRFGMGVVVDVQLPDLEMRAALLKKFASKSMVEVSDEIIMYLAQGVVSHIRDVEGAFNSVLAFAGIMKKPISKDLVDQVLKDMLRENSGGKIGIPWIQKRVAEFYDISEEEMNGKRRSQNLVLPRQVAMRLCQILTDASLNQIGQKFGGRDHTTVMHSCEKVNRKIKQEKAFAEEFERIRRFVDPEKQ